jgi:hypothetical protein
VFIGVGDCVVEFCFEGAEGVRVVQEVEDGDGQGPACCHGAGADDGGAFIG